MILQVVSSKLQVEMVELFFELMSCLNGAKESVLVLKEN